MNLNLSVLAIMCLFFVSSCASNKKPATSTTPEDNLAVHFIKNSTLTDVVEKAEREGKVVFLDVYTDWCLPCKLMTEEVYSRQDVGDFMNDNFVNYKVNAEKGNGPDMTVLYNIQSFPGLLFLDHNGRVLEQKEGAALQRELTEMANRALGKMKS